MNNSKPGVFWKIYILALRHRALELNHPRFLLRLKQDHNAAHEPKEEVSYGVMVFL
jgi:hypothetical protein